MHLGVLRFRDSLDHRLESYNVLPIVAEIIEIFRSVAWFGEVVGYRNVPAGNARNLILEWLIIGYANLDNLAAFGLSDSKDMKVAVQPAHGILNRHMEVPEAVRRWDEDSPPDRRLKPTERHLKLICLVPSAHSLHGKIATG